MQNEENIGILLGINRKQAEPLAVVCIKFHSAMENMAQGSNTIDMARYDFFKYELVSKEERNRNSEYWLESMWAFGASVPFVQAHSAPAYRASIPPR